MTNLWNQSMKIISCGCSFMSIDPHCYGTHFSEIIADKLNSDYACYAKFGSTNFAIRLQIEEAIKQKPDLILIGFTGESRLDVSNGQYVIANGIRNIEYKVPRVPSHIPEFYSPGDITTISMPMSEMSDSDLGFKYYLTEMHDAEMRRHYDYFLTSAALDKLIKLKIPFVFTRGGLQGLDWEEWANYEVDFDTACPWLHVAPPGTEELGSSIYHTTFSKQKELADKWMTKVNELYNLV